MGLVQAQLKAQHEVLQLAAGGLPLHPPLAIALSQKVHLSSIILCCAAVSAVTVMEVCCGSWQPAVMQFTHRPQ